MLFRSIETLTTIKASLVADLSNAREEDLEGKIESQVLELAGPKSKYGADKLRRIVAQDQGDLIYRIVLRNHEALNTQLDKLHIRRLKFASRRLSVKATALDAAENAKSGLDLEFARAVRHYFPTKIENGEHQYATSVTTSLARRIWHTSHQSEINNYLIDPTTSEVTALVNLIDDLVAAHTERWFTVCVAYAKLKRTIVQQY